MRTNVEERIGFRISKILADKLKNKVYNEGRQLSEVLRQLIAGYVKDEKEYEKRV